MNDKMLFVSDLDGTLFDDNKDIPQNALDAIERYAAAGGVFSLATGRTERLCRRAADRLPISAPAVLYNGACVMNLADKTVLYECALDAQTYRPLIEMAIEKYPTLCVEICTYGPVLFINANAEIDPHVLMEHQLYERTTLDQTPDKWLKVMFYAPEEELPPIVEFIEDKIRSFPLCSRMYSCEYYYELVNKDASKGSALKWLANWLNIPKEHVGAMGDHCNDRKMLEWCGHPYVPANATEELKDFANVTVKDNNQGAIEEALADFSAELL